MIYRLPGSYLKKQPVVANSIMLQL